MSSCSSTFCQKHTSRRLFTQQAAPRIKVLKMGSETGERHLLCSRVGRTGHAAPEPLYSHQLSRIITATKSTKSTTTFHPFQAPSTLFPASLGFCHGVWLPCVRRLAGACWCQKPGASLVASWKSSRCPRKPLQHLQMHPIHTTGVWSEATCWSLTASHSSSRNLLSLLLVCLLACLPACLSVWLSGFSNMIIWKCLRLCGICFANKCCELTSRRMTTELQALRLASVYLTDWFPCF